MTHKVPLDLASQHSDKYILWMKGSNEDIHADDVL